MIKTPRENAPYTALTYSQVRDLRDSLGLSRKDFAVLLGVSESLVYLWETQGVIPSPFYQKIIAGIFNGIDFYKTR